ncbi:unnamed protein product, partial [Oncorhynchus mykiss]
FLNGWPCLPPGYSKLGQQLRPPAATRPSLPSFSFTQIQIADVLKELQNLDPYKSAGLDNLDPLLLKLSAAIVATPITSLFNLSFISSEIPFFKGGDTLDPNCYRPISILPCLSKVFESQVNKQITDHLESHRTFSAVQSGFRAGHGCPSATLKTTPFCILLALPWTLLALPWTLCYLTSKRASMPYNTPSVASNCS